MRSRTSCQQRLRHVHAAGRRALLSLVLERAAHGRDRDFLRIGRRVHDDEVLAAGFADEARIAAVLAEVLRRPSATCC